MVRKISVIIAVVIIAGAFYVRSADASATGLNNIPTSDVVPEKTLALQSWANFGKDQLPTYYSGFKYGPLKGVEIGADGKVGTRKTGPATLQFKCQLPFFGHDSSFMPLVGVENISTNTDRAGKVNPYAVVTYDFTFARIHLGYNFQEDNDGGFGGLDKTIKFFNRDLILRTDLKQTDNGDEVLGSVGFLHVLPWNFILESWVSFPSEDEKEETFTVKLNYVISF